MSKEAVEQVIGKAVLDSEFREALFADPDKVLGAYELTEEEAAALKAIDYETMESFAGTVDDRISKVGLIGLTGAVAKMAGGPEFSGADPLLTGDPEMDDAGFEAARPLPMGEEMDDARFEGVRPEPTAPPAVDDARFEGVRPEPTAPPAVDDARFEGVRPEPTAPPAVDDARFEGVRPEPTAPPAVDDARFEGVRPEPTAPPAVDGAEVTGNPFIAFLRRFFGMD